MRLQTRVYKEVASRFLEEVGIIRRKDLGHLNRNKLYFDERVKLLGVAFPILPFSLGPVLKRVGYSPSSKCNSCQEERTFCYVYKKKGSAPFLTKISRSYPSLRTYGMAIDYKVEPFGSLGDFPCGETEGPCLLGFGTGLIPFSGLEEILLEEKERKTVEKIREHLEKKGVIFPSGTEGALEVTIILGSEVDAALNKVFNPRRYSRRR